MKHLTFAFLFSLLTASTISGQTRTLSGRVTDPSGEPLPGATVRLKNTPTGAATDAGGAWSLQAPDGFNTLVFSLLGFETREIGIEGRSTIDVQLTEAAGQLDQVLVVGFGTQSKRRVTSAIASVGEEVFKNIPATDVQNALQGRLPGVVFTNTSGSANSESSIRIRGVGSISAGNQPLFVVDGLVLSGRVNAPHFDYGGYATNPFINLNPNDIESVEVLKDAAASAIYGSRGSNGVILITTKKGDFNAAPRVSIGYWAGFSEASKMLRYLNGKEYAASWNQAALNAGYSPQGDPDLFWDIDAQPSTDWVALSTQKGFEQEANVSVTGGTKTTKYYIGGTMRDEQGILKTTDFKRYAVRANIDQLIGEKLTLGISMAPSRVQNNRADDFTSAFYNTVWTPPNIEAFDQTGRPVSYADIGGQGSPYTNLVESWSDITSNQMLFSSYLNYSPLPGLSLKTSLGVETTQQQQLFKYGSRTGFGFPSGFGIAFNQETFNYNWTALAAWAPTLGGNHDFDITAGFNLTKETLTANYREGIGFADDRLRYIGSAAQIITNSSNYSEAGFTGWLARANYAFQNKYLLTLSARYDGSSRFGAEKRYGFFPAVSAGWVLSDEGFFPFDFVNFLKLRSSLGVAGNAEIGDYAARGLVRFGQNYGSEPGYDIASLENDQLGWERNVQWDAGLEFALWKNRVRGSFGYYIKDTKDLLLETPVPATNGFTTLAQNVGEVRNSGFEFELSADILTKGFQWTLQLNGATLKNEVRRLVDADGDGLDDDIYTQFRFLFRPGESIGTFYLVEWAGVDPENGDALFWNADKSEKLANSTPDANRRIVGVSIPRFTGGFSNLFRYKNFDLSVFFQFKTGYQVYMLDGLTTLGVWGATNVLKEYADRVWTPENPHTDVPQNRLFQANGSQRTSRNLFDGDYLRLKNLTLGYVFPAFGKQGYRLRLFASGQNLWTLTGYPGLDPDADFYRAGQAEQGAILSPPPAKRTYTMGVNVDF